MPYGAAFLPENQDPTLAPSPTPGATRCPTTSCGRTWLRQHRHAAVRRQRQLPRDADADGSALLGRPVPERQLHVQQGARRQDVNCDFSRIDGIDRQANYAPANFDRRHIFNVNWVYEVPRKETAGRTLRRPHQQLAALGRLSAGERRALRPTLDRQRRQQPQHTGSDTENATGRDQR